MIVERHYDDEALIAILGSEDGGRVRDPHLLICNACAGTLSSYRAIADVLGSDAVWDLTELRTSAVPETVGVLREFATKMQGEDFSAEDLVNELLSRPGPSWLPTVQSDERFAQPGVVRLLVEKSETTIDHSPPDAAAMVRSAVDIAGKLDSEQLRGLAWRQYAYVLFYTGDFVGALEAVELAQAAYEKCAVADYNLARVGRVRALIYSAQERFDDAYVILRRTAQIFRAYDDRKLVAATMATQAYVLMRQLRYTEAVPVLLDITRNYANAMDGHGQASTLANLALCYAETLRIPEALREYQMAAEIYAELGVEVEATRLKGQVAELLAAQGQRAEAKRRLRQCIDEFEKYDMRIDAAIAGISLAEVLLVDEEYEQVDALCRRAIEQFRSSGVSHIAEALSALTYLQEAAREKRATVEVVRHVKAYLQKVPSQPSLQFAPPPLPPQ